MDDSYYSRIQRPKYLDRDLQLPIQIHPNVQPYRDSPDEGELRSPTSNPQLIRPCSSRNLYPKVSGQQHRHGQSHFGEPPLPSVCGAAKTVSGASQLEEVPPGAHHPDAGRLPHSEASRDRHFVEGDRRDVPDKSHVLGSGGSHIEGHTVAQRADPIDDEEAVCTAPHPEMVIKPDCSW